MKYLKKFEAAGWDQFIEKLGTNRFIELTKDGRFVSMDSNDKEYLNSIGQFQFDIRCDKSGNKMSRISFGGYDFLIYKDTDDWYFVISGENLYDVNYVLTYYKSFHPANLVRSEGVDKLFRCDQLDGLNRLIDEYKEHEMLKKMSHTPNRYK